MGDGAGAVAEDLDLDVAGAGDEFLDVDVFAAEGGLGFGLAALEGLVDFGGGHDGAGAAAAAAGDGLDDHAAAFAEGGEEGVGFFEGDGVVEAAHGGDGGDEGGGAGLGLVAEEVEVFGGRADEGEAGGGDGAGEVGAFGEEAVAGVDGVCPGGLCGGDDVFDVQVGGRTLAGELVGFVGDADVEAGGVVFRVDGDRGQAEVGGGAGDADGDLATVGDQELLEAHGGIFQMALEPMMPVSSSLAISAAGRPRIVASTSALCSPRVGAGQRNSGRAPSIA